MCSRLNWSFIWPGILWGRAFDLGIDFSWSSAVIWWREVIVAVPRLISGQRFLSIGSWYLWCTGHSTKLDLGVLLNILAA